MLPLSRPIPKHSRSFTDTEQLGLQMTPRGRSNRTGITALAIILATGFILFQLGLGPDSRTYNRLHGTGSKKGRFGLEDVIQQVTVELAQTAEAYDTAKAHNDMGLNLGNLSLSAYTTHLRDTYDQFFSSRTTAPLDKVLANFGFLPPPSPSLPQNVYTTDSSIPEFPPQFKSWASVNPDWQTVFVDDEEIDAWADRAIPGSAGIKEEMRVLKETRGVLRADLFRYLVLLLSGGVYTDTDTACVRPISTWARSPDRSVSIPLLTALPHLARLSAPSTLLSGDSEEGEDDSPSMIIALENDSPSEGNDWRSDSFVRGIQLAQWTILSKPFHPILLDVLGQSLSTSKSVRGGDMAPPDILEWTGPGVFTDAVMRYLLIRWGVRPEELSGLEKAKRFGDIVIMPLHSFRSDASEGDQGDWRVVWHGFFGRWKGS